MFFTTFPCASERSFDDRFSDLELSINLGSYYLIFGIINVNLYHYFSHTGPGYSLKENGSWLCKKKIRERKKRNWQHRMAIIPHKLCNLTEPELTEYDNRTINILDVSYRLLILWNMKFVVFRHFITRWFESRSLLFQINIIRTK